MQETTQLMGRKVYHICWDSTRMHLPQGAEPQRERELYFPAKGVKFSISWDFSFITLTFFPPGIQTLSFSFFPSRRSN